MIISNKKHEFTIDIVKKYFADRFHIVFGHRENYEAKPDPTSVLEVIDNFNILKSMLFKTKIDLDITIKEKESIS